MSTIRDVLIRFFPVLVFSIFGSSMIPTLQNGEKIIAISTLLTRLKKNNVVICQNPQTKQIFVKRITKIINKKFFVEGDNKKNSIDSRKFGWIEKKDIFGKVIYPKTVYNT